MYQRRSVTLTQYNGLCIILSLLLLHSSDVELVCAEKGEAGNQCIVLYFVYVNSQQTDAHRITVLNRVLVCSLIILNAFCVGARSLF